ncbi:hypothetical protein A4A49_33924 [Nicotiana attenuata]|uniref:Uncharacterized protein n=1 Tax=Nicotiana attenuata TaxID=49451 RepID=A0A314KTH6_NICAT|nr:hypothetical protein A4A49_33924 [Nicotiana attenuata]
MISYKGEIIEFMQKYIHFSFSSYFVSSDLLFPFFPPLISAFLDDRLGDMQTFILYFVQDLVTSSYTESYANKVSSHEQKATFLVSVLLFGLKLIQV